VGKEQLIEQVGWGGFSRGGWVVEAWGNVMQQPALRGSGMFVSEA